MPRPQQAAPPGDGVSDSHDSGLQAIAQVSARLAGEFMVLQSRAVKLVLAETTQRQRAVGRLLHLPFGEPHYAQEMQAIARRWAELLWLTQSAFIRAFFSFPSAPPAPTFAPERRVSARIIRFPERRAGKL